MVNSTQIGAFPQRKDAELPFAYEGKVTSQRPHLALIGGAPSREGEMAGPAEGLQCQDASHRHDNRLGSASANRWWSYRESLIE